tara:strand:+ start:50 stop:160 length:111 start_codon:yes stop_codon:yes gene_type:complete
MTGDKNDFSELERTGIRDHVSQIDKADLADEVPFQN